MNLKKCFEWYSDLDEVKCKKQHKESLRQISCMIGRIGLRKKIEPSLLDLVMNDRKSRLHTIKPASSNRELSALKTMLTTAANYGRITRNPIIPIKSLKENNARIVNYSQDQIEDLIKSCDDRIKEIVMIGSKSLMRWGEIVGLTWGEIDFKSRGFILCGNRLKNGESRFTPIHPNILDSLKKRQITPLKRQNKVFTASSMSKSTFAYLFRGAADKCGMPEIHFHDLRHFAANNMRFNGADISQLMKWGGWKNVSTFNRYSFITPGEVDSIKW